MEFTISDGEVHPATGHGDLKASIGATGVVLHDVTVPEMVGAAAVGRPLSSMVQAPFPHGDPPIAAVVRRTGVISSTEIVVDTTVRHLAVNRAEGGPG